VKNKGYYPIGIHFKEQQKKDLCQSLLQHLRNKTGYNNDIIIFQALQDFNVKLDERGNLK